MSVAEATVEPINTTVSGEAQAQAPSQARTKALALAGRRDWLAQVLAHHQQMEAAFARVKDAPDAGTQRAEQHNLAILITAHVIAEENVLYPAMALGNGTEHATTGYNEQAAVKIHMAALEKLAPMSDAYMAKLEQIRAEVAQHMCEEEGIWFPLLKATASETDQAIMTLRYREEFKHYFEGAAAMLA